MDRKLEEDLKQLSIYVYQDGTCKIPSDWKSIYTKENIKNGFYGEAFYRNGEIVIVYRGTDTGKGLKNFSKDLIKGDAPMTIKLKSGQQANAMDFYKEIHKKYGNKRIILSGHSLGGSLAQIISAVSGRKAVTFNAYGTGDILSDMGYKNQRLLDITNYGNQNDIVFQANFEKQPGTVYLTNTDLNPSYEYVQQYQKKFNSPDFSNHNLENMDKLENSVKVSQKGNASNNLLLKGSVSYDDYDPYQKKGDILAKLKEPQESRLEKIKNKLFKSNKEKEFDEKADHSSYVNEVTKTNKIFTKEDISNMPDDELKKNKEAIDFQKQSLGVPSSKQAKASGMVFVSGYTRSDGIEVKSYYRTRASFA